MEQKFSILMSVYAKDKPALFSQTLNNGLDNIIIPAEKGFSLGCFLWKNS